MILPWWGIHLALGDLCGSSSIVGCPLKGMIQDDLSDINFAHEQLWAIREDFA